MKERPILFSAPMVRAILEGRKTQTRRKVFNRRTTDYQSIEERDDGTPWPWRETEDAQDHWYPCPYGQPGDRLWVRETWRIGAWDDNGALCIDYFDGPRKEWVEIPEASDPQSSIYWRLVEQSSDDAAKIYGNQDRYEWEPGKSPCRWRPSIHMPRWASRILLEVTGVRVERLADISKDDAMAEGIVIQPDGGFGLSDSTHYNFSCPTDSYCSLWESINGPGSWDANPWVWVVEFKRVAP